MGNKESELSKAIEPNSASDAPVTNLPSVHGLLNNAALEEAKLIRRMQMMMSMVMQTVRQL